jgi:hypothetical protein
MRKVPLATADALEALLIAPACPMAGPRASGELPIKGRDAKRVILLMLRKRTSVTLGIVR